jgi:predicted RNA binding protein YcfA (HicA-like mRNA interferase family)
MKAGELRRLLTREPLSYTAARQGGGSHTILRSPNGYPDLVWAFHTGQTLPPGLVRKILMRDVGLSDDEAEALL